MCKYPRVLPPIGPQRLHEWLTDRAREIDEEYGDYLPDSSMSSALSGEGSGPKVISSL